MENSIICFIISMVLIIGMSMILLRKGKRLIGTNQEIVGKLMTGFAILWFVIMSGISFTYFVLFYFI